MLLKVIFVLYCLLSYVIILNAYIFLANAGYSLEKRTIELADRLIRYLPAQPHISPVNGPLKNCLLSKSSFKPMLKKNLADCFSQTIANRTYDDQFES